ncbi:hypothetical protein Tco_0976636 [Tanacetum coccineum]|uniref:Reverse transcriptase domain-containing protein n=1 Tax=Tanacetum coccineum TaxID=301880 RepID=A0ABQ5EHT2_9ASTR
MGDLPVLLETLRSVRDAMEILVAVIWAEIGESSFDCTELVQETTDKVALIKEKPKAARDRQKSYADNRRKPLEFEVGDRVMLKVLPWKGVIRFGKKGKLAPRLVKSQCGDNDIKTFRCIATLILVLRIKRFRQVCDMEGIMCLNMEVVGRIALDDDDVLDVPSLDSRYNAKKVMRGLMYRCGSSDDGNVVLCVA